MACCERVWPQSSLHGDRSGSRDAATASAASSSARDLLRVRYIAYLNAAANAAPQSFSRSSLLLSTMTPSVKKQWRRGPARLLLARAPVAGLSVLLGRRRAARSGRRRGRRSRLGRGHMALDLELLLGPHGVTRRARRLRLGGGLHFRVRLDRPRLARRVPEVVERAARLLRIAPG